MRLAFAAPALASIAALCAVLYSFLSAQPTSLGHSGTFSGDSDPVLPLLGSVKEVPAIEFSTLSDDFAQFLVDQEKPVVLKGCSHSASWKAFERWDEAYFRRHLGPALDGVYVLRGGGNATFNFYDPVRPLHPVVAEDPGPRGRPRRPDRRYYVEEAMAPDVFFSRRPGETLYYTGKVEWLPPRFAGDVSPNKMFATDPDRSHVVNVWLGQRGATSGTHYDTEENFYVQVRGRKSFTLFAPDQWQRMYPFPRLHPEMRQSQVDFSKLDLEQFPLVAQTEAWKVVLHPGDVLFLPAFWWHRVIALDDAMSVNVWTKSASHHAFAAAFEGMRLPFGMNIDLAVKVRCLKTMVDVAVGRCLELAAKAGVEMSAHEALESANAFVRAIAAARFRPSLALPRPSEGVAAACATAAAPAASKADAAVARQVRDKVAPEALRVADLLFRSISPPVLPVALGDWIEELANAYLGPLDAVTFMQTCWR